MGISYNYYCDLHFNNRPDISPYLYHFTRSTDEDSAFINLITLLQSGVINGSNQWGFVRGNNLAACFIDIPDEALHQYFKNEKRIPSGKRHEPYGIMTSKRFAFNRGARPVIYLPEDEIYQILKPKDYWRVVRLDLSNVDDCVCFLHEREWRCKGSYKLAKNCVNIFVKTKKEAIKMRDIIKHERNKFPAKKYRVDSLEEIQEY